MDKLIKPAAKWRDEFCNKYVVSTKGPRDVLDFIYSIQINALQVAKEAMSVWGAGQDGSNKDHRSPSDVITDLMPTEYAVVKDDGND